MTYPPQFNQPQQGVAPPGATVSGDGYLEQPQSHAGAVLIGVCLFVGGLIAYEVGFQQVFGWFMTLDPSFGAPARYLLVAVGVTMIGVGAGLIARAKIARRLLSLALVGAVAGVYIAILTSRDPEAQFRSFVADFPTLTMTAFTMCFVVLALAILGRTAPAEKPRVPLAAIVTGAMALGAMGFLLINLNVVVQEALYSTSSGAESALGWMFGSTIIAGLLVQAGGTDPRVTGALGLVPLGMALFMTTPDGIRFVYDTGLLEAPWGIAITAFLAAPFFAVAAHQWRRGRPREVWQNPTTIPGVATALPQTGSSAGMILNGKPIDTSRNAPGTYRF